MNSSKQQQDSRDSTVGVIRRKRKVSTVLVILSIVAISCTGAEAFGIRKVTRRILGRKVNHNGSTERFADKTQVDSWSKSANKRSSPLQVRRRVKAVLEKARTRTGVNNSASKSLPTVGEASSIAEAASIGGIGNNTDWMIEPIEASSSNGVPVQTISMDSIPEIESPSVPPANGYQKPQRAKDLDAIAGDVPAANAFVEPLPFKLPNLSDEQKRRLNDGERIQEQSRMGREGSGYVVLDVHAPPYVVWECLLDFESYPETIPTVREMQLYTSEKLNIGYVNEKPVLPGTGRETRHYGTPSVTRALFILSKFRLNIAAVHRYTPHPNGDYMIFNLDKSCTNMVLKGAKGIWYTEENPDGKEGYTRVYLLCEVKISRALPSFIVDYAAERAMPRATTWLRPLVETAADLWLKRGP